MATTNKNNMIRSLLVAIAFLSASLSSVSAHAVDMFTFDGPQASQSQSEGQDTNLNSFRTSFNSAAMQQETVVVNLPHKRISATRMSPVGDSSEQIMPYAFEAQKGTVMVNSNDDQIESIVVFDEEAKQVFKGYVQEDGSMLFNEVDIDTYICDDFATHEISASNTPQAADISYYQSLTDLTLPQVTSLQSRPGASKVLYIDYLAGSVSGTAWNVGNGAPAVIDYDNYSYDGDPSTFSLIDLQSMYAGWAETAEDYAPFDVNVTTDLSVYNAAAHINKSKIVSTSTNWRGSGGVAYVGVFGGRNDDYLTIGWTFNSSFGSMGMTNSHESGHQMGLSHDGLPDREYYPGAGNSGPIMGGPFGLDFVHWNKGDYPNANQTQNDISIVQARLGVIADDHGSSNATSTPINSEEIIGFISPAGVTGDGVSGDIDVDVFSFTLASSRTVNLSVRSLFEQFNRNGGDNTAGGLNLSAKIELRNSSNGLVQQKLPSSNAANNGFDFSGNLATGTYYLSIQNQAYVGANFNEYGNGGFYQITNNLESTPAPDLLIQSPAVDDDSLQADQPYAFSASVRNSGNAASASTTLRYYLSTDATISSSDISLGTDSISALSANASSPQSIDLTAPSSFGNYYVGACIDNVSGEVNTVNNCSVGVLINVASSNDLVVQSPAVDDSSLTPGQSFALSATVRNQGNDLAPATTLTYYRSTNSFISVSDTNIGSDAVASLNANGSSTESINLTAPTATGNYYYGACVAAVNGETNTGNNCSASILVTVSAAPTVDLIVESPAVDDSTLQVGQAFVLSASVRNQGNANSAATSLTYYRSTNATISTGDTSVGTDAVASLSANGLSPENINLTAPAATGNYYYGACVTSVSGETSTNNNCSAGVLVTVSAAPTIDLIVESPAVNDSTLQIGQAFVLSASVRNQGNANSAATSLTYYRSTNATISTGDTNIGTDAVASLSANGSSPENINLTAPAATGSYYYGACVTSVSGETVTNNNCSAGVLVTVSAAPTIDLIVESPAVNDSTLDTGQAFILSASVRNQGNASSAATSLTYYRSTNATISTADTNVGTDAVASLSANGSSPESINLTAPATAGSYYYGACVTSVSGETSTNNNCSTGVLVNVTLVVSPDSYEPNNSNTSAKAISRGQIQAHSIHQIGDQDWLRFSLSAPAENLSIETSGSGADDTRLWLYDSSLNELAFNNNGGVNNYSRISMANTLDAGTYYILIDELGNNSIIENYTVSLNFDSTAVEEEQLCLPIKAQNGKITLICL